MPPAPLEPVAALNGRLVPLREACVSIIDDGIVQGATITERIRTFAHRPYLLEDHLQRLRHSLASTGVADLSVIQQVQVSVDAVIDHNVRLLENWQDLAIVIFVTPGPNRSLAGGLWRSAGPTVCVHTSVIPPPLWAALAASGVRLVTPAVRQPSTESIDPQIKHRSRLHWFVAEQQARQQDSGACALLLDAQGHVTETSSGNLLIFDGTRLVTPRADGVLGGISRQVVSRLAQAAGVPTVQADLTVADVLAAREAFLTSTGYCVLPVTHLNGRMIGDGRPGPFAERLLCDWSAQVGVDIVTQHRRAAGMEQP